MTDQNHLPGAAQAAVKPIAWRWKIRPGESWCYDDRKPYSYTDAEPLYAAQPLAGIANLGIQEVADAWAVLEGHGFPPEAVNWPEENIAGKLPQAIDNALTAIIGARDDLLAEVLKLRPLSRSSADSRDEVATHFLACDAGSDLEWARVRLREWKDAVHYGDCTKAPITCNRCCADEAYKRADTLLDVMRAQPQPTPLMDSGGIFTFLHERMEDETSASLKVACRALADHLRVLGAEPQEAPEAPPACWRYRNDLGEVVSEWIDGSPPEYVQDVVTKEVIAVSTMKIDVAYSLSRPERHNQSTQEK